METKAILVILSFLANINPETIDLEKYNLKNQVWEVKETSYQGEKSHGEYQLGNKSYSGHAVYIFNENGYLIEEQALDKEENVREYFRYNLNEDDNLIKKETLDGDEKIKHYLKYRFDQNRNSAGIDIYQDNTLISKIENEVENNQIVESKMHDENGNTIRRIQYHYSGSDIVETKIFDGGNLYYIINNQWNDDFLTKEIAEDNTGKIIFVRTYQRNKNNDVIKSIVEYPEDSSKIITSYTYEYDDNENWIRQHQFDEDGKIGGILVRDISYYE